MRENKFKWAVILTAVLFAESLHADIMIRDSKANIIYQYSNGVMFKGPASRNQKIFKYDPNRKEIWNMNHKRVAFWKASENALYPGNGGRPMYIYADKGGHPGSKGAKAVIFIDGRKIYHGHGPGCKLILYPDSVIPVPVALYLAHTITGGKPPAKSDAGQVKVDFSKIPYGYYLGKKGEGKIILSLRGNKIFFNDKASGDPAYTFKGLNIYRGADTKVQPVFSLDKNGNLYKGNKVDPANKIMSLEWFNCYAPGKSGTDAIGTLQYVGENILTEGYTKPARKPDFTGKRILLSSTLPNNRVPMGMRIFLVYLTQLDPDFKAYCGGLK